MIRIKHRSVSSGILLAATSYVHQSFHEEPEHEVSFPQCLPFCSHIGWREDSDGYIRIYLDISQILLKNPDSERPWC